MAGNYYALIAGGVISPGFPTLAAAQTAAADLVPAGLPYVIVPHVTGTTVLSTAGEGAPGQPA
jgi:hypothetical protein